MLRKEVLDQMAKLKKDQKTAKLAAKRDADKKEQDFANDKLFEEVKKCQEKILKLANQFDKELSERDKAGKKSKSAMWDDIQQLFTQH